MRHRPVVGSQVAGEVVAVGGDLEFAEIDANPEAVVNGVMSRVAGDAVDNHDPLFMACLHRRNEHVQFYDDADLQVVLKQDRSPRRGDVLGSTLKQGFAFADDGDPPRRVVAGVFAIFII